jgi:endoglucanase
MQVTRARNRWATLASSALCAIALIAGWAGPAAAETPLPAPGAPVLTDVTRTSAAFSWSASTGPVTNYTVQVIDAPMGTYHDVATTPSTHFTHSGLTPDSVYVYRIVANAAAGSGYSSSPQSDMLWVRTLPLPDSIAPTAPGTPTSSAVSTIAATLRYAPATDNNRVAGYVAQLQIDGVWTDVSTNNNTTIYLRDLAPDTTYTAVVVAFDPNGNRSPRSAPVTFRTRSTEPLPTCRVQVTTFAQSYILNVSVENMTAATILDNWSVSFAMPATHTVSYTFNTTLSRAGDRATALPAFYNTKIGPGGTTSFGFSASYPVGSALPSGFRLNNAVSCASS